jgi:uncharacterized delta-60 repeat protein
VNIQNTSLKFLRLRTKTSLFLFSLLSVSGFSAASARADLAADNNFRPSTFAKATPPERALLLPDGRYLLFFDPDTVTDQTTGPIARFLADGTLDTSFSFSREYKTVCAAVPTADGKLYVAAIRYLYGVKDAEQILRLNGDGSIDPTFAAATVGGTDSFPDVWQLDLQADGKLLVAGFFRSFAGDATRNRIVRLMSNGTVDPGFAPSPVNNDIYSVALQTDGKIVIGGIFTSVNGVTVQGITRLNADGNVDPNFQATGFTRESWPNRGIAVQPDGQILVCGRLRIGSGVATKRMPLVRLSATGALDSSFDSSGVVFGNTFQGRELAIQADGKIVAAVSNTLYRFNTTGSKDTGFRQPVFMNATLDPATSAGTPDTVQLSPDAHIFVGGTFTDVDPPAAPNYAHFGVVRLNPDGNVDGNLVSTHHPGNETAASSFSRLGDGSTLATFRDKIDPAIPYNVARLLSDGSVDPTFTLSSSDPSRFLSGFSARGLEPLPDGNFFVYGNFGYGKVRPDGTEDTSFATNKGAPMQQAMVAPDGKILLTAGTDPQTTVFTSFGRLSADGHFDNYGGPINGQVVRFPSGGLDALYVGTRVLAVQPDGKALLQYFSQDQRFHLIRLNADSSADGTFPELIFVPTDLSESFPFVFDPQSGTTLQPPDGVWSATPPVQDAYVQTDGRIILTGHFTTFGNSPARGIVRLESTAPSMRASMWAQACNGSARPKRPLFFRPWKTSSPQRTGSSSLPEPSRHSMAQPHQASRN